MPLTITRRRVGNVMVLDCVGQITLGLGSSAFRDSLRDATEKEEKIVINLGLVNYIDGSGIGELVSSVARYRGQVKLCNVNGRVKDLLQITKLYTVFQLYDDESTAIQSF